MFEVIISTISTGRVQRKTFDSWHAANRCFNRCSTSALSRRSLLLFTFVSCSRFSPPRCGDSARAVAEASSISLEPINTSSSPDAAGFFASAVIAAGYAVLNSVSFFSRATPASGKDKESAGKRFRDEAIAKLGLPVVVKPSKQGSTVGLSVVKKAGELAAAIAEAFRFDDEVMIERFIAGRELTVGILGEEALPVGEIIPKHEIYDYECKYQAGMAVEEFPAKINAAQTSEVQECARRAFRALKLRGYARIDFRMSEQGGFYCLEANTLPGMTQTSLIPQAAAAAGLTFPELCERIVRIALEAHGQGG